MTTMQRILGARLVAGLFLIGACFAVASAQVTLATEPVAMAQTTSSVSSKAFTSTPAPVVVTAPSSPAVGTASTTTLAPARSGIVSPLLGAVVLIVVVLAVAAMAWRRRRPMRA